MVPYPCKCKYYSNGICSDPDKLDPVECSTKRYIERIEAEVIRIRALVESAFWDGANNYATRPGFEYGWNNSKSRATLEKKT